MLSRSSRLSASSNSFSWSACGVSIEISPIRMPRSTIRPATCSPGGHSMIKGAAPPSAGNPSSVNAIRQLNPSRDIATGRPTSIPSSRAVLHASSRSMVEATQASGAGDDASRSMIRASSSPNHRGRLGATPAGSTAITSRYVSAPVAVTRLWVAICRCWPPGGTSIPRLRFAHWLPASKVLAPTAK